MATPCHCGHVFSAATGITSRPQRSNERHRKSYDRPSQPVHHPTTPIEPPACRTPLSPETKRRSTPVVKWKHRNPEAGAPSLPQEQNRNLECNSNQTHPEAAAPTACASNPSCIFCNVVTTSISSPPASSAFDAADHPSPRARAPVLPAALGPVDAAWPSARARDADSARNLSIEQPSLVAPLLLPATAPPPRTAWPARRCVASPHGAETCLPWSPEHPPSPRAAAPRGRTPWSAPSALQPAARPCRHAPPPCAASQ